MVKLYEVTIKATGDCYVFAFQKVSQAAAGDYIHMNLIMDDNDTTFKYAVNGRQLSTTLVYGRNNIIEVSGGLDHQSTLGAMQSGLITQLTPRYNNPPTDGEGRCCYPVATSEYPHGYCMMGCSYEMVAVRAEQASGPLDHYDVIIRAGANSGPYAVGIEGTVYKVGFDEASGGTCYLCFSVTGNKIKYTVNGVAKQRTLSEALTTITLTDDPLTNWSADIIEGLMATVPALGAMTLFGPITGLAVAGVAYNAGEQPNQGTTVYGDPQGGGSGNTDPSGGSDNGGTGTGTGAGAGTGTGTGTGTVTGNGGDTGGNIISRDQMTLIIQSSVPVSARVRATGIFDVNSWKSVALTAGEGTYTGKITKQEGFLADSTKFVLRIEPADTGIRAQEATYVYTPGGSLPIPFKAEKGGFDFSFQGIIDALTNASSWIQEHGPKVLIAIVAIIAIIIALKGTSFITKLAL